MALINYLTRVHFADRVLEDALAEQMAQLGILRPLLVADLVSGRSDPVTRVSDALPKGCKAVVRRIEAATRNQPEAVSDIQAAFVAGDCDGYIAVGSEATLNLARRAVYEAPGPPRKRSAGLAMAPSSIIRPRLLAIPTTTACVGLQPMLITSVRQAGGKKPGQCAMLPDAVLCDPTLTLEQAGLVTAATGMDALTHCIEAYLGTTWNPPADGIALDGVRRAVGSLASAVRDGNDLDARREMMAVALNAGLASHKGLGAIEALSHALDEEISLQTTHGYLHAALFPCVVEFNAPAISTRMEVLRDILRLELNEDVPQAVAALGVSIHLPATLAALNLDRTARRNVARRAMEHPASGTNPRHATAADYVRMLEHASG
ncbi:MAG: iron-containing alcohol dehydrogenase [Methylocystis sp.]|nr:iron-containing alcohol dehydrogenase [Methylocystis sp.]MCA3585386.1 iron-containing alcohol dehydrogenase [Methylocystis sp.]MCA3587747.1 iron-containing alcohol dehydrogenase [Methylocystis sp.]MCA3593389.1 iron-containing alcohol dehydrogenase [Methylocystis sp.]